MEHFNIKTVSLKHHPSINEAWIQDRIAKNPALLGIGDLFLKDKERAQPGAGRLDLLLEDPDENHRYEVEIQLGKTDASHIIRTIEYWDIERKRYPKFAHTAVIVAEEITGRFLNVISLFNGTIPLIAIQMKAVEIEGKIGLLFTTVLDRIDLGFDEERETEEPTDRQYWESRSSNFSLKLVDRLLALIHQIDSEFTLKYNKVYVGLQKRGIASNFVTFRPKKKFVRLEIKLDRSDETDAILDEAGLDAMDYNTAWKRYRIRITPEDLDSSESTLSQLIKMAYGPQLIKVADDQGVGS